MNSCDHMHTLQNTVICIQMYMFELRMACWHIPYMSNMYICIHICIPLFGKECTRISNMYICIYAHLFPCQTMVYVYKCTMVTWVHKGLYWYVCMYIVMHVDLDGPCAGAHSQKSMWLCTSRKSADFETFTVMPYSKSRSALTFWEILVQPSRSID